MIRVKKIMWYNDEKTEADLILSNGSSNVTCYCYPCKYNIGDEIDETLFCYNPMNLYKSSLSHTLECIYSPYSYKIVGTIMDANNGIIESQGFTFDIGNQIVPKEFNNGDCIEFTCEKITI